MGNGCLLLKVTGIYKKADAWLEHQVEQLNDIHQHMGQGIQNGPSKICGRQPLNMRKNIFACLFSVYNTISLSRHEQVCLIKLRFEIYFSYHRPKWWEKYPSKRSLIKQPLKATVINSDHQFG